MDLRTWEDVSSTRVAVLAVAATIFMWTVGRSWFRKNPLSKFPLLGQQYGSAPFRKYAYLTKGWEMSVEGYNKFPNAIYRITTYEGDQAVIPPKYLDELKQRPDDDLSGVLAFANALESRFTGMGGDPSLIVKIVKHSASRALGPLNLQLAQEVNRTLGDNLPPCADWTAVNVHDVIHRIVATVSGYVFIGADLCRREEYLHSSVNYAMDLVSTVTALKMWPRPIRFIGARLSPELRRLRAHSERGRLFWEPIVRERKDMMERGEQVPDDLLQWCIAQKAEGELVAVLLQLSFAAIHATSIAAVHLLYDLTAEDASLMDELRREAATAFEGQGDGGQQAMAAALDQMRLLDSCLRESQRMNPNTIERFVRLVVRDVTLTDGTVLPQGTTLHASQVGAAMDETIYPSPSVFDPNRFLDLRSGGGGGEHQQSERALDFKHRSSAVSAEHLGFGLGRHACPGRFLAIAEIKLISSRILLDFDIKMPDGVKGRYPNKRVGPIIMPDATKVLMFKRRG